MDLNVTAWWCSTILSSALISACGGGEGVMTERLGKFDPELPPELYCAGLCGDGECIAFSGEDCGTCLQDCGGDAACPGNGTLTFSPGATSLSLVTATARRNSGDTTAPRSSRTNWAA